MSNGYILKIVQSCRGWDRSFLGAKRWAKSHFTLLKANKSKPNRAKKIGYISNERPDLGVPFRYLVFHFNKMEQHRTQQEIP